MTKSLISVMVSALLTAPAVGFAQSNDAPDDARLDPGQTVADREQPEYAALGIRSGSFIVYPEVTLTGVYDDNLFYEDASPNDDFVTKLKPSVRVVSDWNNHELIFNANVEAVRHADHSDEDMDNYGAGVSGRLDVTRDTRITGGIDWARGHEGRGSPDAVNGKEPTGTDTANFELGLEHRPGRIFVLADISHKDMEFDNVDTSTGTTINNADRNRTRTAYSATLGYEIQPQYSAFLRYTRDERDYDDAVDDNGFNRDSTGDQVEVGVELDLSGLVTGEVAAGYMERDYEDANFQDTDDWSVKADVYWQASPLTTVVLNGSRIVSETTSANSSGFVSTGMGVRLVHELRRNFIIDGSLALTAQEYEGISREDDLVDFNLSATYDVTREFFIGASYDYNQRDGGLPNLDYDRNAVTMFVGLRR